MTSAAVATEPRTAENPIRRGATEDRILKFMKLWVPSADAVELMGPLPDEVDVVVVEHGQPLPKGGEEVEFVVPSWMDKVAVAAMLPHLTNLKVVQVLNAGYDWVTPLVDDTVTICNAGDANAAAVADWCAAAILTELRLFPTFARQQIRHTWAVRAGKPVSAHTIGILGYGAIGKSLHERLRPFGCTVVPIASRAREAIHGVDELAVLLPSLDVLVCLTPLTDATHGLVNAEMLALMRNGSTVVNAGRGAVVDTEALLAELVSGRLRAVLDVTDPEPLPADHALWDAPNVRITPHVAGATTSFFAFTYPVVAQNVHRYLAGEPLTNVVQGPLFQPRKVRFD